MSRDWHHHRDARRRRQRVLALGVAGIVAAGLLVALAVGAGGLP